MESLRMVDSMPMQQLLGFLGGGLSAEELLPLIDSTPLEAGVGNVPKP